MKIYKETPVVINKDGSVYPFIDLFDPEYEEDELVDGVKELLSKQGRILGTLYVEDA
jgi:hypothetical protein